MDKVIIIDGVDVSECKFRLVRDNKQRCECCHATGFGVICNCESWHDCYYKQLKRLEQENERLKLSERDLSRICQAFKKDIETEKSYKLKYYKALQEIRCVVDKNISFMDTSSTTKAMIRIQAKINEVIGAE